MQIMKRLQKKATETGEDPYLAVLNYRASPLENGLSPAEILMNRKLLTKLPSAKHHKVQSTLNSANERQMKHYNRTAKPLSPLAQEEIVRVRCDGLQSGKRDYNQVIRSVDRTWKDNEAEQRTPAESASERHKNQGK